MRSNKVLILMAVWVLGTILSFPSYTSAAVENIAANEKVFEGEVVPLTSSDLKYGFNDIHRGILDYVARPGSFFKPASYDAKGNIIREGDVLIHMDPTFRISCCQRAKADLEASAAAYKDAKQIYLRNEKLVKCHSISEAVYQTSKMEHIKTKAVAESAKYNLEMAKQLLELCTFRAPFEGVVDQVLVSAGLMAGEQPAIKISQLVPIGIKVKMDRKTASQITVNIPIKIYPSGSNVPVGVLFRGPYYTVDGKHEKDRIVFTVDNYQILPPVSLDDNGKKIPMISNYASVLNRENIPDADYKMAIMMSCIYKDQGGDYVWKLKGNSCLQPGKGSDYISPVQKVYIKTGNFFRYEASYIKTITVQPNEELKVGDVLLSGSVPNNLKDGEKVCLYDGNYLFMPGDSVKVVVGFDKDKLARR